MTIEKILNATKMVGKKMLIPLAAVAAYLAPMQKADADLTLSVMELSEPGQPFYGVSGNGTNVFGIGSGGTRTYDLGLNQQSTALNSGNVIDGGAGRNPGTQTLELQSNGNLRNVDNATGTPLASYNLSFYSPTAVGQTVNIGGVNYVPFIGSDNVVRILNLDDTSIFNTTLTLGGDFENPTGLGNYMAQGGLSLADLQYVVTANPGGDGLIGDFNSSGLVNSYSLDLPFGLLQDVAIDTQNSRIFYSSGSPDGAGRVASSVIGNEEGQFMLTPVIPEPGTLAFLAIGGALIALNRKRFLK